MGTTHLFIGLIGIMNEELKAEHKALLELLPELYNRARAAGLVRTSRALADSIRLASWESASLFDDNGILHRRRHDDYAVDLTIHEEEISIL